MMDDDPFLISKNGEVWACWLNGKPAVNLGSEQNFWVIAEKLFNELHPSEQSSSVSEPDGEAAEPDAEPVAEAAQEPDPPMPDQPQREQVERDDPRYDVTVAGRLYATGGSREVTIFDLSIHGCRVEDYAMAKPGGMVTIKIGTIGPIGAVIRWRRDNFIGLKFETPLYPSVLDNIRETQSIR